MKIEPGRGVIFVIVLSIVGIAIHSGLKQAGPLPPIITPIQPVQVTVAPKQPPATSPIVSISKIWPDGATPTRVMHIPDPQEPAKGLLEINLHQGDDLELDFDPLWTVQVNPKTAAPFPGAEVAVNSGKGFETLQEYSQNRKNSGTNAWWAKSRIMRIRLAAGQSEARYDYIAEKITPEHLPPPVKPQAFGDLLITFEGLQVLPDRKALVYLTFHNKSSVNTVAVAMHDEPCTIMPCQLASSLLCSDGTPFVIYTSEITGINGMRTSPKFLTAIEPGQELKTSLKFEPRGNWGTITSVKLQTEIVVNSEYRPDEYMNFRETGRDFLPPYCAVINAMFDIPVRHQD